MLSVKGACSYLDLQLSGKGLISGCGRDTALVHDTRPETVAVAGNYDGSRAEEVHLFQRDLEEVMAF